METVSADYGKRVYQGVRVKHTVKDLLAEKRLRQTSSSRLSGNIATTQPSFVPMSGSAAVSGYGGVRRALMAEADFQSNKQLSGDGYPSSLIAKPLPYDSPMVQSYPPLLDTHFMDQYVNHRTAPASSGSSSLFGTSSLTPIFPSDAAHFSARDAWEHSVTDSLGQADECSEPLQLPSAPGCLSSHEPGEPSHYRSPSWSLPIPGTQSYPFPALEDAHYAAGYSSASPYPFSSFMTTMANELPPKMLQASSEESSDAALLHDTSSLWPKEDGSSLWGFYECRRTY